MSKKESDIGHVYHSLKNSRIRDCVFNHACNNSQELSAREIATSLGYSERSVLGALIGDGKRYKKEDSLTDMGLTKCYECIIHGYTILLFSVTDEGLRIFQENKLKDYVHDMKDALTRKEHDENDEKERICKEPTS